MLFVAAQIGIFVFGATGQACLMCKNRWGVIFSLSAQPCWFYSMWTTGQWGTFAMCFVYTGTGLLGLWNWWLKPRLADPASAAVCELEELRAENARLRRRLEPAVA